MKKTFICSDPHFSHANILKFKRKDGKPLRPHASIEEHDQDLIDRWNSVVGPEDRVYLLGDVAMGKKGLSKCEFLNGKIVLDKGNHDEEKITEYVKYFEDIRGSIDRVYAGKKFIATHIPIHPTAIERFNVNFHGHYHANYVDDPRYLCLSMEHINYTPITLEEAFARVDENIAHFATHGTVIDFSARYVA